MLFMHIQRHIFDFEHFRLLCIFLRASRTGVYMQRSLVTLDGQEFDVVVIGAGINGTSTARELAVAGYSVFLCDKDDFASGATSRSSRMLHCGLRYFETHRPVRSFGLHPRRFVQALTMARDGMNARSEIATTAGDGVRPFTMCFPVYPGGSVRGWHLEVGLRLLRQIGPASPPLDHSKITGDFAAHLPFAGDLRDVERLQSITTYREYLFDWPDRFCVDAALEAEGAGAVVRNFCIARPQGRDASGRWSIGCETPEGATATVKARLVFNMAGSSIDAVNATAAPSERPARRLIRGTKGAHIMVRLPKTYQGYGIATMHRQGMPFYCLPSHDDYFYFGPTETAFEGDAQNVVANDADIDFLLAEANYLLPGLRLERTDVALTWAGVRPLTWDDDLPMGRRSREIHDLSEDGMPGIFAMTAGPVMSHRSAARALLKKARATLGGPVRGGRKAVPFWKISQSCIRLSAAKPPAQARRAAIRHAVLKEHARDLNGILYTRNAIAWRGHLSRDEVQEAAQNVADLLEWSEAEIAVRVDDFLAHQKTVFRDGGQPGNSPE